MSSRRDKKGAKINVTGNRHKTNLNLIQRQPLEQSQAAGAGAEEEEPPRRSEQFRL